MKVPNIIHKLAKHKKTELEHGKHSPKVKLSLETWLKGYEEDCQKRNDVAYKGEE